MAGMRCLPVDACLMPAVPPTPACPAVLVVQPTREAAELRTSLLSMIQQALAPLLRDQAGDWGGRRLAACAWGFSTRGQPQIRPQPRRSAN